MGSDLAMGTWFVEGGVSHCHGNVVCGGWGQSLPWERCLQYFEVSCHAMHAASSQKLVALSESNTMSSTL